MRRHSTVAGRIVYDRKPHLFRITDVYRIMDHIFVRLGEDPSLLAQLLYDLSIRMLEILLQKIGLGALSRVVYLYSFRVLDWWIGFLSGTLPRKEMEGFAKAVQGRLKPWLPPEGPSTFQRA